MITGKWELNMKFNYILVAWVGGHSHSIQEERGWQQLVILIKNNSLWNMSPMRLFPFSSRKSHWPLGSKLSVYGPPRALSFLDDIFSITSCSCPKLLPQTQKLINLLFSFVLPVLSDRERGDKSNFPTDGDWLQLITNDYKMIYSEEPLWT